MNNNKNMLIGGLLAVVLVMAVGYAAFSSSLKITSPTSIGTGSAGADYWKVGFDNTKTTGTGVVAKTGSATCGTISYSNNNMTANISSTSLTAPGDSCTYTLTVKNTGQLAANLGAPTVTGTNCSVSGLTCTSTSGHIKFTVTGPASTSLAKSTGTTTMTVKAEFPNTTVSSSAQESSSVAVTLTATQA